MKLSGFGKSNEEKSGDSFLKGIVSNGGMEEINLDIARRGALGEYGKIWEIRTDTFEHKFQIIGTH